MLTLHISVFLISAAALALELILIRALSIAHYHHFSYLIISTALLGFGAAGTFICICSRLLKSNYPLSLWAFALALAWSTPIAFLLAGDVPFDELQIIWDRRQLLYLLALYLLFCIPFFSAGAFIGLAFTISRRPHGIYFSNMTGSGLGVIAAVLLMYNNPPAQLLLAVSLAAVSAAVLLALRRTRTGLIIALASAPALLLIFNSAGPLPLKIRISQHKAFTQYTAFADAETLATRYSPLARLDVVNAPAIRHFPGLSIAYQGSVPDQMLLISDAASVSPVNHFETLSDLACYDYTPSALAWHLIDSAPEVCIIGSGGGSDVTATLAHDPAHVTAVEINPQVINLLRGPFADFASRIYDRSPVRVVCAEGRNFLQTTDRKYDIIEIALLESSSAAAAGVYALNENHLFTVQAFRTALNRLRSNGFLCLTRMLRPPAPRDTLKVLTTAKAALRREGVTHPADHIIVIRGLTTAAIFISPKPIAADALDRTRRFCNHRSFDLVFTPDIQPDEVNRFNVLPEPAYHSAAMKLFSPQAETFIENYVYDIRPATDDRPYFSDFFKFRAVPHLMRTTPGRWLQVSEYGYLILLAALAQAGLTAAVLILLPVFIARPVKRVAGGKLVTLTYFLLLGLAYMFLEMAFIQKTTLLTGRPVFGVAVTLLGFLVFSACGAIASLRLASTTIGRIRLAALAIVAAGGLLVFIFAFGFNWLLGFTTFGRFLWALVLIAPLAFFMGMPFPAGLAHLAEHRPPLLPWAWGINGFASVTAAVLGTALAMSLGFSAVTIIALAAYIFAALLATRLVSF